VGSVADEAAKLFAALAGFAREHGGEYAGAAAGMAGSAGEALHDLNEHIATGSQDCRYCPVCQVIHVVRTTSPEVRAHLAVAATSLAQAAAAALATQVPPEQAAPVQRIDLDDDPGAPGDGEG
jgi:hypothetical protein